MSQLGIPTTHHPPTTTTTNSKLHKRAEIEQNSGTKSYFSILGDPKTFFEPYPNPKINPLGPQKVKNEPQNETNQKSEMKKL